MLPEILSNNLCSLRPNEDKYTIVSEILISNDGQIKSYKFYNALIQSSARLTYSQVDEFFKNSDAIKGKDVIKNIQNLFKLYDLSQNLEKKEML